MYLQKEIKWCLVKRGYTQRDFAEVSGILYQNVGNMCTNKATNPNLQVLGRCCEILKCELTDIMELVIENVEYDNHIRPRLLPRYDSKGRRTVEDV
jgi:DNA-binding Xre family transcriptional regulator